MVTACHRQACGEQFMIGHPAGLRRLDGIIWAIVALLAAITVIAPFVANFRLVGPSFLAAGGGVMLCLAGYWLYETRRPDPRLASAVGGTAQIVAFAAVGRAGVLHCRQPQSSVARCLV